MPEVPLSSHGHNTDTHFGVSSWLVVALDLQGCWGTDTTHVCMRLC